ncbi:right-handed parallel beta-helix repeat-containing protein [Ruegeria sp.]|uniref:right-handed parallel beta-helix repeat-containing protein n=1 Tax=Ruegeria sp. TaxID=1879320 RepID=UPI003B5BC331
MRRIFSPLGLLLCAGFVLFALAMPMRAGAACGGINIAAQLPQAKDGQTIRTGQELAKALKTARGGETFLLASGNYGAVRIQQTFKKPVTIRSASPQSPACLSELRLSRASNITFDGIVFDYTFKTGDKNHVIKFEIRNSHGITITNSVFDGAHSNGIGHGRGLFIRDSSKVTISDSTFSKWMRAITAVNCTHLNIQRNQIYDIRADGMAFSGIDHMLIEDNRLHNFRASTGKDHRDMIQVTRTSNKGSSDIVIRNNVFDIGAGDFTQTIFMGRSGKNTSDPLLRHRNILIENNVIYNAHLHGISIYAVDGLSIRKNSIIRVPLRKGGSGNGKVMIPRINVNASTSVVIEQNAVSEINGYKNQSDWVVLNNAMIQDQSPSARGFYDREFVVYATGKADGYHEYGVRPGSEIDRLGAGSTLVKSYPSRR